jgi:hypothetical protein
MEYTLSEVHEKLKQFADKMNSDYFPLPVLLSHFETATLKFIGSRLRIVEKTQEVTDDLRSLIVPGKLVVVKDSNDPTRYVAALPVNYLRLVSYDIHYADGSRCRRADLKRQAEYITALNDPNKKPTKQYPIILQEANLFQIDAGGVKPSFMAIKYCKKPTIATTGQPTLRIVNLPDDAIEEILLSTVTSLFNSTADQRVQSNYQLEEAFRKVFK